MNENREKNRKVKSSHGLFKALPNIMSHLSDVLDIGFAKYLSES
jgi:hypothetical protein